MVNMNEDTIVAACCSAFNVHEDDVYGRSRKEEIVVARQTVYYFLNKELALSCRRIGEVLGRDRTTVYYGIRAVRDRLDVGSFYDKLFQDAQQKVYSLA